MTADEPRRGRRRKRDAEDELAWWWATRNVAPLPGKEKPEQPVPDIRRTAKPGAARPTPQSKPPAPIPPAAPSRTPALHPGKAPGLDRRTLQRLGRGLLPAVAEIDLHGMGRTRAHEALAAFLAANQRGERVCVRVVTGHGQRGAARIGVLRELVPRWLNEPALRPRVLAFAVAQPHHGGHGALYVLLRKKG